MPRTFRSLSYGRNNCSSPCNPERCVAPTPGCGEVPPCPEDLAKKAGIYPFKNIFGCLKREELLELLSFAEGFRLYGDFFDSDLSVLLAAAHFKTLWEFQENLSSSYLGVMGEKQVEHPLKSGSKDNYNYGWHATAYGMQYLDLQVQPRNFAIAVAGGSY